MQRLVGYTKDWGPNCKSIIYKETTSLNDHLISSILEELLLLYEFCECCEVGRSDGWWDGRRSLADVDFNRRTVLSVETSLV